MPGQDHVKHLLRVAAEMLEERGAEEGRERVLFPGGKGVAGENHAATGRALDGLARAEATDPDSGVEVARSDLGALIYYVADML